MRQVLRLALIASVLVLPIEGAQASHRPKEHCSRSGDVCRSVKETKGDFKFKIGMNAKYFEDYKLCVKGPDAAKDCKIFNVARTGRGAYGDSVSWVKNYQPAGTGDYTVYWEVDGTVLGKKLGFHVTEDAP